jgi:hypothetical protein
MTTQTNQPHAERAHARYAPSGTDRWLECPGSVPMSDGIVSESSVYAEEGTAAHELGEKQLRDPGFVVPPTTPLDMQMAVSKYVNYINSEIRSKQPFFEHIEKRFTHPTLADFFGTGDYAAGYMDASKIVLHFVDYKHGAGVAVDAHENKQLLSYALLVVDSFGVPMFDTFRVTVVQPRCPDHDPISTWEFGPERLDQHREAVKAAMASTAIKAGAHCRWCPAAVKCPKLREHMLQAAQAEFPATVEDKDVSDWLTIFSMREAIKSVLEQIETKLIAAAMRGVQLPGHKVVESWSHRRWKQDEAKTLKVLAKHGIGKKLAMETSLRSPSQMEKVDGVTKEMIAPLVHQEMLGHRVVSESTRGKPAKFDTHEFDAVAIQNPPTEIAVVASPSTDGLTWVDV